MTTRQDVFAETVDASGATLAESPFDATIDASSLSGRSVGRGPLGRTTRSAVLPRAGVTTPNDTGERYAQQKVLGTGGMGEVVLAEDRDIGRNVALKYLSAPDNSAALARFVDEIRIVGSLEHPNIVPIHDVGRDENNRYYFVMKHVEGETLEQIIERLAAGDRAYHARYTFTARIEIFIALLRALEYAHAHGYVHRDIKPANVMVGPYGEVVLMDWGVAKRCKAPEERVNGASTVEDDTSKPARQRLYTTRRGAIVGTPAYMSPEQSRGEIETIDERSDIYCASVLLHELMTLRHYLDGHETLPAMLAAIQNDTVSFSPSATAHPSQGPAPAEYVHVMRRGLAKEPSARFQNVREMIDQLQAALDGRVKVECPVTFTKRFTRELGRFVDRHPFLGMNLFFGGTLLFFVWIAWSVFTMLRHG